MDWLQSLFSGGDQGGPTSFNSPGPMLTTMMGGLSGFLMGGPLGAGAGILAGLGSFADAQALAEANERTESNVRQANALLEKRFRELDPGLWMERVNWPKAQWGGQPVGWQGGAFLAANEPKLVRETPTPTSFLGMA